jgi:hypothetical protein
MSINELEGEWSKLKKNNNNNTRSVHSSLNSSYSGPNKVLVN